MFGFEDDWLLSRFLFLIPMVASLTVHEWAHAFSALLLGDQTANRLGRVTLNPLEHIDPIGTFLLPMMGVPFGWAKPVPINPAGFRQDVGIRTGLVLTAAAGPVSNVCIAFVTAAILGGIARFAPGLLSGRQDVVDLLQWIVVLNVVLASFNMIPIPPLDGSRIVDAWMPDALRPAWDQLAAYSHFALLGVIVLPMFAGVNLLAWPMSWADQLCAAVMP